MSLGGVIASVLRLCFYVRCRYCLAAVFPHSVVLDIIINNNNDDDDDDISSNKNSNYNKQQQQ